MKLVRIEWQEDGEDKWTDILLETESFKIKVIDVEEEGPVKPSKLVRVQWKDEKGYHWSDSVVDFNTIQDFEIKLVEIYSTMTESEKLERGYITDRPGKLSIVKDFKTGGA